MTLFTGTMSGVSQYQVKLDVWTLSQSINNNTSTIQWVLYLRKTTSTSSTGYWSNNESSWSVSIGGKSFSGTFPRYDFRGTAYHDMRIASDTVTLTHNSVGTGSFWTSATISASGALGRGTASGTYNANGIPRYATLTAIGHTARSATSVEASWATDRRTNEIQYRVNGGSWKVAPNVGNGTFGTFMITGLNAGATSVVEISAKEPSSGLWSYKDMSVYPFKLNTGSSGQFVVKYGAESKANLTINRTVPNSTTNAKLYYAGTNTLIKTYTNTTGGGMTLTPAESNNVISRSPNSSKTSIKIVIETVFKGSVEGTTTFNAPVEINPEGIFPTIGSITYFDNIASTTLVTNDDQLLMNGLSGPVYKINTIRSYQSSTLKTIVLTDSAGTITNNISGSNINHTISGGISKGKEPSTVTVKVTDSRGFSTTKSISTNTADYFVQNITGLSAYRKNGSSQEAYLQFTLKASTIPAKQGNQQRVWYRYRYKEVGTDNWSAFTEEFSPTFTTSGNVMTHKLNKYVKQFDTEKEVDFQIQVVDMFEITKPDPWPFARVFTTKLSKGISLLRFTENELITDVNLSTYRSLYQLGNKRVVGFKDNPDFVPTASSFNNYWMRNVIQYTNSANANSAAGSPKLGAGRLEVYNNGDYTNSSSTQDWLYATQIFTALNGDTAIRNMTTDRTGKQNWSAWKYIPTAPTNYNLGDWVIEQGSNSNGQYWKYNSGKLVCQSTVNAAANGSPTLWGSSGIYYLYMRTTEWTFPVPFVGALPNLDCSPVNSSGFGTDNLTLTKCTGLFQMKPNSSMSGGILTIVATGRWK